VLAAACLVPSVTRAAVLETEPFNYPSNLGSSLNGLNGGTGWANAWSNADGNVTLASTNGSLSYPASVPLTPSGSRVAVTAATTLTQATRNLGTTMNLATGGQTWYSSALFNPSAVAGESAVVNFIDNSGNIRWTYGIDGTGHFTVSVNPSGQQAATTTTLSAGTTYLLVSRIRTNTGPAGNDEVFLKVFAPGDAVAEPATDAGWDITANGNSGVTLTNVRLDFANAAGQTNQFDEFRVGTTFTDVTGVPEPAGLSLLTLPALALLRRRRPGR